jgi:outer membrane protein assembly factor BamB
MKRVWMTVATGVVLGASVVMAQEWPMFRGPNGLGVGPDQPAPVKFDGKAGENLLWKVKLDARGESSPVIAGDKVFVTGGDTEKRWLFCYNAKDGALLWKQEVKWGKPAKKKKPKDAEEEESEEPELKDYVASNTPATDGKRVYVAFATGDIVAFDLAGKKVWSTCLWPIQSGFGWCSSLLIHKNKLVAQLDHDGESGSALIAFDCDTGKQLWKTKRNAGDSFQSPILAETKSGTQIVTSSAGVMNGYNADTGEEIWSASCGGSDDSPSPAYANDIVVAVHSADMTYAVKTDGKGNVTKTHVIWTKDDAAEAASPVAKGNLAFVAHDEKLSCYALDSGKELWSHELEEKAYASLVIVGDKGYFIGQSGQGFVFQAADKFKELGKFNVGEGSDSTPAFSNGRIYIRGNRHLWCFGEK